MTEKEVQLLGFQKENLVDYDQEDSYYYVLDIVDGLTFITPSNDEVKNNDWYVEVFNTEPSIRFHKFEKVQGLINKLTKAIVKK
jgi:hypothetical protein